MAHGKATSVNWAEVLAGALGGATVASVKEKRLGSLWAGYGHVSSLTVALAPKSHAHGHAEGMQPHAARLLEAAYETGLRLGKTPVLDLIVKQVAPPRGAGVSHDRKIRSYEVEAQFYRTCTPLLQRLGPAGTGPSLPVPLHIGVQPPHTFTFVLSDLRQDFPCSKGDMDLASLRAALTWLAHLHASFWEVPAEQVSGLWQPQGSYWHLDTRQEELGRMGPEWAELKAAARKLDLNLKGLQPDGSFSDSHMTVCHGDFKSANILFSRDASRCAAFDFQYVGRSFGARDIAYLLCSSADEEVLEEPGNEELLLRHYHSELMKSLAQRAAAGGTDAPLGASFTFDVLQRHFQWALMDFVRFMAGWGMWGAAGWGARRARQFLAGGVV